jgi:hypothetical protein
MTFEELLDQAQALALAETLGMRPLAAHCRLGLGTLYGQVERREQACSALSTAIELYRAMDMTFWLRRRQHWSRWRNAEDLCQRRAAAPDRVAAL